MTNQLCLQQQWSRLYKKMLCQLAANEIVAADEKKWIEWGFSVITKTWSGIQQEANNYVFDDQQEEIAFYKVVKPRFIGLLDYFTHLYKSVLFQPEDQPGKKEYWEHELEICKNFLFKHRSFCSYYEQGNTSMDHTYFVQQNNQQPLVFGANESKGQTTSYSYLLARVLSIKKYCRYIQEKIDFLTNAEPN